MSQRWKSTLSTSESANTASIPVLRLMLDPGNIIITQRRRTHSRLCADVPLSACSDAGATSLFDAQTRKCRRRTDTTHQNAKLAQTQDTWLAVLQLLVLLRPVPRCSTTARTSTTLTASSPDTAPAPPSDVAAHNLQSNRRGEGRPEAVSAATGTMSSSPSAQRTAGSRTAKYTAQDLDQLVVSQIG